MRIDQLRLLYELIDTDLTSEYSHIAPDEALIVIEPLLQQFVCEKAGRKTMQQAEMDVKLLRTSSQNFEDFCIKALDLLLSKRPVTDFV